MIEIQNVSKRYGNKYAVKDVTFTINKGEILGFLGRNGAGKSTTMNMITGYISSSAGRILLDGYDILKNPREVKRQIGYLPELPPLYMDMTVDEYLRFCCDIKGVARKYVTKHLNDICELTGLGEVRKRLIKNLSKGYKQRVGLAQALVGNPEVVILDEPTVGLDPKQIIEIRRLIRDLGEDHTVVLSSHILPEVADVCERLVIINNGQIVAQDTLENLTHGIGETYRMTLRVKGPEKEVRHRWHALLRMHRHQGAGYLRLPGRVRSQDRHTPRAVYTHGKAGHAHHDDEADGYDAGRHIPPVDSGQRSGTAIILRTEAFTYARCLETRA